MFCFPGGASDKEPACQCRRHNRWGFDPWLRKIPWRRAWQSTPENHMDIRTWWATIHRIEKSQTRLKRLNIQCFTSEYNQHHSPLSFKTFSPIISFFILSSLDTNWDVPHLIYIPPIRFQSLSPDHLALYIHQLLTLTPCLLHSPFADIFKLFIFRYSSSLPLAAYLRYFHQILYLCS